MPTRGDPIIDLLAIGNLDGALALSASAGWNQRLDDWRMLLRLAPAGSFAAIAEGRVVGTAIGIDYGGFGWIAMMLVDPAYRGRGVGRRLLEAAIGAVPSDHPIRLDATPLGRPLYQRYGFEDEALLTRHVVSAGTPRNQPSHVRRLTAADLKTVTGQDDEVFGGNRGEVLEWALDNAPLYGHVVQSGAGLAHYCLGRQGRLFDQIGPVVAGDDDIAAGTRERRTCCGRRSPGRRRCVRYASRVWCVARRLRLRGAAAALQNVPSRWPGGLERRQDRSPEPAGARRVRHSRT